MFYFFFQFDSKSKVRLSTALEPLGRRVELEPLVTDVPPRRDAAGPNWPPHVA